MKPSEGTRFYAATDVGCVRPHNEDNFLVDKKLGLYIVCDGMGGHAAGEVASAIAVRTVHEEIKRDEEMLRDFLSGATGAAKVTRKDVVALFEHATQVACARIHQAATVDPSKRGMGTTLSALLLLGQHGFVAHVGDSRIYLIRGGRVQQVTEDHTVATELAKRGRLSAEQIARVAQKNAITRAVGIYERVEVDSLYLEVLPGDVFVVASDGLTGYLETPDELAPYLALEGDECVKGLVDLAKSRGGKDNITCIAVRVGDEGSDEARRTRLELKRELLARMPLFSKLTERELLRVMQICDVRDYAPGERVVREGERGEELFIVLRGSVRVSRGDSVLSELGVGEHFGEMALIRSAPRSASVSAAMASELIVIRRADFFEVLRREHEVAVKMLWQFLGVLADRLDQTSSELGRARVELLGGPPPVDEGVVDLSVDVFPEEDNPSSGPSGGPLSGPSLGSAGALGPGRSASRGQRTG
jgi:serine/threonine protein phosphatase PrpC